jgi:hypothetical protein
MIIYYLYIHLARETEPTGFNTEAAWRLPGASASGIFSGIFTKISG